MSGTGMLLAANIAVWSGIVFYLLCLGLRQSRLERRLQQLELSRDTKRQSE